MIPSKYQKDVYDFIINESGNCVISAVAGSGKTTTIVESLKFIPSTKSILFLAFNKSIVEELKNRVPAHVKVRTFHSLGYSYILTTFPNMKMDNYKFYNYSEKHLDKYIKFNYSKKQHSAVFSEYKELISLLRNNAIAIPEVLTNSKRSEVLENIYNLENKNFDFDYIVSDDDYIRGINLLHDMNADRKIFDYNDMIYLPINNHEISNNIFTSDFVLVDESQDLNITQQMFLDKLIKPNTGRLIAVGDERQAIYGFAGADIHSFNKLTKRPNTSILPLSYCYRCGTNIIKFGKTLVPQIESPEGKEAGIIRDGNIDEAKTGDIILSRVNKNLVSLFFTLLKNNKKSYIKGKDIGENLIKLIKKSEAKNTIEFDKFTTKEFAKIKIKLETKIGRIIDQETFEESNEYIHFFEKTECIKILYSHYEKEIKSLQSLTDKITEIFKDEGDGIMLSTVHKAKGLENSKVFILDAHMFPATFAKEVSEKVQEQNLFYVAITRAKDELVFVNDTFERKVFRSLLFKDYENVGKLFSSKRFNVTDFYFLEDAENYKFDFTVENKKYIYSPFKKEGYVSILELKNKVLNEPATSKI